MAVLQLQFWPAEVLKQVAQPVTEFGPELLATLENMAHTMYVEHGIGLAAPQVAISERMLIMDVPLDEERRNNLKALVNPELISGEGEIVWEEGCLSFPGILAEVTRYQRIVVRYQDYLGEWHEEPLEELEAVCFQHELDHLNGINFIDYLTPLKRKLLIKDLKKTLADRGVAA